MLEITLIVIILALAWMLVNQSRRHTAEGSQQQSRSREAKKEVLRERDQLLDALGDAFLLVSETSHIVFANECARKLVKGRRLQGRSIMEAFLDDALSVAIMRCIRTGKPMQERVVLHSTYTPLGSVGEQGLSAWVIDAAPLESYSEKGLTRVVIRDVTTEHQADQVRRDFVANASHELRTPMAIINGYLENLLDDDLLDDGERSSDNIAGLFQSSKDAYLRAAAFNFSQAWFKVRGYDSSYGVISINGIEMNKLYDGRPQWGNWGGLNDVFRNQEFSNGLAASDHSFGNVLGTTNFTTRVSDYKAGGKVSTAATNKSYTGRIMANYATDLNKKNWAFAVSASRRFADEGYFEGTTYNAWAAFLAVEKK